MGLLGSASTCQRRAELHDIQVTPSFSAAHLVKRKLLSKYKYFEVFCNLTPCRLDVLREVEGRKEAIPLNWKLKQDILPHPSLSSLCEESGLCCPPVMAHSPLVWRHE